MNQELLLKKISNDIDQLKEKVMKIEFKIEEMNPNKHKLVRDSYVDKLKEISKGRFISDAEFNKELEQQFI